MKMKKRTFALIILVCFVSIIFTGCFSLEEMRKECGIHLSNGNLRVGEYEYIKVEDKGYINPVFTENKVVYITEEEDEVPLLLRTVMGERCDMSDDERFIYNYTLDEDAYFCREDCYDAVQKALNQEFVIKGYKYDYYDYEKQMQLEKVLTQEECDAINEIFATGKKKKDNDYDYDIYITDMYSFSEPYLRRYEFEIVENNQKLYLVKWEGENGDAFLYKVPQDKMIIVQGIIKEAMEEYKLSIMKCI